MQPRSSVFCAAFVALLAGCGGRVTSDSTDPADGAKTGTTPSGNSSGSNASGSGTASGGDTGANGSSGTSGSSSSGGSTGSASSGTATGTATCADLPLWTLTSVDDARAALAVPFPNAWQLCAGYTSFICPTSAPVVSFAEDGTTASCGNVYEGGFKGEYTFPITITQDETGVVSVRWLIPDGSVTTFLTAYGSADGAHEISFSLHGDPPPPPTRMAPAPPLP